MTSTAIAVFGYRRSAHLAQTLTSLQNQKQEVALPIYLFLDGPRSEHDREPVEACHQVAQSFAQQLAITIYPSMHNRGLYDSLTSGISLVLREHEQVVVMEDDIVISPFFLEYLLAALACYRGDASVASIHGYLPPIPIRLPETFFLRGADCWGWATWRDRWSLYRHDAATMAKEIRHRHLARAFNLGGGVPNLALLERVPPADPTVGQSAGTPVVFGGMLHIASRSLTRPEHWPRPLWRTLPILSFPGDPLHGSADPCQPPARAGKGRCRGDLRPKDRPSSLAVQSEPPLALPGAPGPPCLLSQPARPQ